MSEDPSAITAEQARELTGEVWMNREETAKFLGVSPQTLANHRHDGPKYSKMFGAVRYRLKDVQLWAKQREWGGSK